MGKTKLKPSVNESIRNDGEILLAIAKATGTATGTVRNWFYKDAKMLTDINTLKAISKFTGIPIEDLVEDREMINA